MENIFSSSLRNFPGHVKFFAGSFLLAMGVAYIYALLNVAIVIGFSPKDVTEHYHGTVVNQEEATKIANEGEMEIDLDAMDDKPVEPISTGWSFKNLVSAGHFHMFGMSTFFFGLCLLGLFVSIPNKIKSILVSLPFVLTILDNLSFMAVKFLSPHFSFLTIVVGTLMGLNFTILWLLIAREVISKPTKGS